MIDEDVSKVSLSRIGWLSVTGRSAGVFLAAVAVSLSGSCADLRPRISDAAHDIGVRMRLADGEVMVLPDIRPLPLAPDQWELVGTVSFEASQWAIGRKDVAAEELRTMVPAMKGQVVVFVGRPAADAISSAHARAVAAQRAVAARRWVCSRWGVLASQSTAFCGLTEGSSEGGMVEVFVSRETKVDSNVAGVPDGA